MTTLLLGRICRTCLLESSTMHKLLDAKRDGLQIDEMLYKTVPNCDICMEVEEDTPLPIEICNDCLEKLQVSYDFQQMCIISNERLKNFVTQQEVEDVLPQDVDLNGEDLLKDSGEQRDCYESENDLQEICKLEHSDELMTVVSFSDGNILERHETIKVETLANVESLKGVNIEEEQPEENFDTNEHNGFDNNCYEMDSDPDDEYWPNDDKDNSESNILEDIEKTNGKATRKYKKRNSTQNASNKTCPDCHKIFKKRMFLTRHMSVHSLEHQFVCDICQYRYATEKLLKIHISYKHKSGVVISLAGGPYQCPDCPMIFQQTRALAAHRVMHLERDFKCEICGINLKTLAAVTRHMNCKHPGVLPYKCEICEQAFPVETHYKDHINMHKGYKKHKCEMCDKSFPNTTALKDHMRTHTGESPYLCSHCGKSFKTANILRQHLQRHGDKNFQCPECPMRFYVKVNLQKHMCTHSKEKPYVCDVCGSSFTRGDSLKAHKFKHSGERPFKCEECKMSFVFKRHLMRHKITHTGEKPHMCTYCDRSYAASGDLVKHLRTHLGANTYFCDECSETFKYQHDLRDHKNQHYKERSEKPKAKTPAERQRERRARLRESGQYDTYKKNASEQKKDFRKNKETEENKKIRLEMDRINKAKHRLKQKENKHRHISSPSKAFGNNQA